MKIQPIVEGHGDVAAFPVLLRCLVAEARSWSIGIGRPIRVPRGKLVQQAGVERAVRLALLQPKCGAVLILFDGDRDCPAQLGPTVQAWAAAHTGELPCRVVIAHREYEAWFLATGAQRQILVGRSLYQLQVVPKTGQFIRLSDAFHGRGNRSLATRRLDQESSVQMTRDSQPNGSA